MKVVRRRDGALLDAKLTTEHPSSSYNVPVLVIDGEAYGCAETHGYALKEADESERVELKRWGYNLIPVVERTPDR